jgi:Ankyrin repeat
LININNNNNNNDNNRNGFTALMAASVRGHQEIVQSLVSIHADLDLKDNEVTFRTFPHLSAPFRTNCAAHALLVRQQWIDNKCSCAAP